MRKFLHEYAKAVLVVASIFGGIALAFEVPAFDTGARWVMRELFHLTIEYRGPAIAVIVLGLAGMLTAMKVVEGKHLETDSASEGR
ncbi:hypothetical protein VT84_06850 [Gemmata sp. SH-PL17]|uniref:hypothetical protein n=1 Tax=Gemmata sp. SH-PL17 TaxID=1630693 RepID=UPI00078CD067|nr:hypothetical protein [Gemmata sp. SH-PL17]AMV24097.1 hypothetical protein VT84_06850 [Gemmata sp. SH-PL17]